MPRPLADCRQLRLATSILALLAPLFASACGTQIHYIQTNTADAPTHPRQARQVEIYTTGAPNRAYTEVGYFEAEEGTYGGFEDTLNDLRADAARRGCDALVVEGTSTATDYDPWVGMRTERRVHATCIVYEDGPRRADEPAAAEPDAPRDWETEDW